MAKRSSHHNFLKGARVYLSGPMDFVSSREREAVWLEGTDRSVPGYAGRLSL
jgi:hypothetical protein